MPNTKSQAVTDYIATQSKPVQTVLKRVRSIVLKAMPDATEVISYQIPAYKLHGRVVLFFAGWAEHFSIYPAGGLVEAFENELASYPVSKGTIRFPLSEPVPVKLIERIAKFRAKEAAERAKAKTTAPKQRSVQPKRIASAARPGKRASKR